MAKGFLPDYGDSPKLTQKNLLDSAELAGARLMKVYKLNDEAKLPTRSHEDDIGYDLYTFLYPTGERSRRILIPPNCTRAIPTGLIVIPPDGHFMTICSRSGMASATTPVFVPNGPGIIDPGYRGELKVLLYNGGHSSHWVSHGDRVGQIVFFPIMRPTTIEIEEQPADTIRGEKGFGSTGD